MKKLSFPLTILCFSTFLKKAFFLGFVSALLLALSAVPAKAISLDIRTITSYTGLVPTRVSAGIVVSGLGDVTSLLLGAFDLDFLYQSDVLGLTEVVFGPSLGDPDTIRFSSPSPNGTLTPDISGTGNAITGAQVLSLSPGRVNILEVSLLEADPNTCIFCNGPFLDDLQGSLFNLVALRFDVLQTGTFSHTGLFVDGIGDAFGNSLAIDNAVNGSILGPSVSTAIIPEPSTMLLLGIGLAGLASAGVRKRFKRG